MIKSTTSLGTEESYSITKRYLMKMKIKHFITVNPTLTVPLGGRKNVQYI